MKIIGHIYNDFSSKFGIPRQSGIVNTFTSVIVLEPEYRDPHIYRGLEGYSHIWILWQFSEVHKKEWSPTVRPPKLGGNTRIGVFASRSPFRPNPIGLSSVKIDHIDTENANAPLLYVTGADLMNGTPIYDIKPYIPYTDCHTDALGGYAVPPEACKLTVAFPPHLLEKLPQELRQGVISLLEQDPRPGYQEDSERIYGLSVADFDIRFSVKQKNLTVVSVKKSDKS